MGKAGIVLLTLLVIVIIIIVGLMTGFIPLQSEVSLVDETQLSPIPSSNPSSPTPSIPPSQNGEVKFEFAVTDISGSGLSRTITAQVTNTGDIDAHNVWGKVEVFSQGSMIKLGSKEFLRIDIGTITYGGTATTEVTLSFGLTDGLKILQNGATFVLTIYSDELTETFSYDYSP
ncbi:hypothetical protein ACFLU8_02890 [Chloroflexota bacterium]